MTFQVVNTVHCIVAPEETSGGLRRVQALELLMLLETEQADKFPAFRFQAPFGPERPELRFVCPF